MSPRLTPLLALLLGAGALGGCEGRPRTTSGAASTVASAQSGPAVAEIDLSRGVTEAAAAGLFGGSRQRTTFDLLRTLASLGDDGATKGILVRLGGARVGFAGASEIGRELEAVRKRGKPVICHADEYANDTLALAARGCSRLWVSPAGSVDAVGIAAQLLFGKKLLARLSVDVDFLQVGKFKGAEEPFTRESPSPEARASLERALRGVRDAWLAGLRQGRPSVAVEAFEDGPFSPEEAKSRGVVDAIGDADDARHDAEHLASVERTVARFGGSEGAGGVSRGLVDALRSMSGSSHAGEPHVALVRAVGGISMGSGSPLGGSAIVERDLGRLLTRLTKDPMVKAVVLRIDSPGGSALASDLLWKKLMALRAEKPLVVSVGAMAASGGYYLASAANRIVAERVSIVGSIGVVGGKLSFSRALEEIGVHAETVAASPNPAAASRAGTMSPLVPWDGPTKERVLASMTSVYELFLKRIVEGRSLARETVEASAEGQVFAGDEALGRKLVDELGGLTRAIELARELGKLPGDVPVVPAGDPTGLFGVLTDGDEAEAAFAFPSLSRRALAPWIEAVPELGVFVESAAPLVTGERALAALPFAVVLR